MRARAARLSLLGRFSLLSFVVIAVIGTVMAAVLERGIEHRALSDGARLAEVTAHGVQSHIVPQDLRGPVRDPARLRELDRELRGTGLLRIKVYNRAGTLVYSDDHRLIGSDEEESEHLQEALEGGVESEVTHGLEDDGSGQKVLEVYTPLRSEPSSRPEGVFEIYLPYAPVATAIADDRRTLYLLLAGGLLILWATLFRIVAGASRRLRHQTLHDSLTGLANRRQLHASGKDLDGQPSALLLIDLDRFKEINDTLGHEPGDRLLIEVADRLRGVLRKDDALARLGGDEFAVLVRDLPYRGAAAELSARVHAALGRPFVLHGVTVELEASIGVALYPEHGDDVATLLRSAEVAMYQAKHTTTRIETYATERDPYSADRLALLGELRRALDEDELILEYQPKVSLTTGQVTGVEALVRWRHPTRGLLAPGEFVPLAERTGMIALVTRWVLDTALRQVADWRSRGYELEVAVNLAAANIVDTSLPEAVAERLQRWGLPGEVLVCEISEHTVMSDPGRVADVLSRLRAMQVRLSLDDFGSGQSSLSYLKRLPLDEVKLDRSFVAAMTTDDGDQAIVRATIDLARHLGLRVVAEGVETEAVLCALRALRCGEAQGFFLARSMGAEALEDWIVARSVTSPA